MSIDEARYFMLSLRFTDAKMPDVMLCLVIFFMMMWGEHAQLLA